MVFHLACYYMLSLQCVIFVYRQKNQFWLRNEIFGLSPQGDVLISGRSNAIENKDS